MNQKNAPTLEVVWYSLDQLSPDPDNKRVHNERNLAEIRRSLEAYGQQKPIVVDSDLVVRAGNGVLLAARELGWSQVAAVQTDLAGDKARAFAVMDNRAGDLSEFDEWGLLDLLNELDAAENPVGYSPDEIQMLNDRLSLLQAEQEAESEEDAAPPAPEPDSKPDPENPGSYRRLPLTLTHAQDQIVRSAVRHAKADFNVDATPAAIAAICKQYLEGRESHGDVPQA